MFPSSLSVPRFSQSTINRDVKEVPFVEFLDGRLQGVVSSGSDIKRVYISYFEVKTLNYYCSTNNNRPCGGLGGGSPCSHLINLFAEAVKYYGLETTIKYLQIPVDTTQLTQIPSIYPYVGQNTHTPIGEIFSRFLAYLQLLELPVSNAPLPEMDWFNSGE